MKIENIPCRLTAAEAQNTNLNMRLTVAEIQNENLNTRLAAAEYGHKHPSHRADLAFSSPALPNGQANAGGVQHGGVEPELLQN